MEINFSYAPGMSLEQLIAFEMAGQIWSDNLADDVTVNIHVETTSQLPGSAIGGALPGMKTDQEYEDWRIQLANDRTSADDQLAFENQQHDDEEFTALIDGYKVDDNESINMTRANAKALGMLDAHDQGLDGVILMSDLSGQPVSWDYNFTDNVVSSNALDYLSVALHEIGHVLGFVSGVDDPGWLTQASQYDPAHRSNYYDNLSGNVNNAAPLDMFRYSAESAAQSGAGDAWIDMSIGGAPYFSIDGGNTALAYYATGVNTDLGGDGDQASHWKQQDNPVGVMAPLLRTGQQKTISTLDRRIMDVIGWDLQAGGTDLRVLENQAKENLAQQLGITVAELDADPTMAAQELSQDRAQDVQTMVEQSRIYEWGWASGNDFWWENGLWQHFLAQEIDLSAAHVEPGSVNEQGRMDRIEGGAGDDLLSRGGRNDQLAGDMGGDFVVGGLDGDSLIGELGGDRFVYNSPRDRRDPIRDPIKDVNGNGDRLGLINASAGSQQTVTPKLTQALRWKQMGSTTVVPVNLSRDFSPSACNRLLPMDDLVAADFSRHNFLV